MKVLVTGGCGFLGSNISQYYREKGAEVIAFDNLAKHEFARIPYMRPEARDYNLNLLRNSGIEIIIGDVRNKEQVFKYAENSDYICHAAAQPAMTISWEDPELDFSTNVVGTFNVLEAARKFDIPVVVCSSVHTYGPDKINSELLEDKTRYVKNPISINEDYPLLQGIVTPLHASKRTDEIYVQAYIDTFNVKAACFRLTGIYGPNQFGGEDHGWVANFAIRTLMGYPIKIFGTGKQLRDILYASDVVEAFESFRNNPVPGIYVLGGGERTMVSLLECIEKIEQIIGKHPRVDFENERLGDLRYFVADNSRFTNATKWRPKVLPDEGIRNLVSWIGANQDLFIKNE